MKFGLHFLPYPSPLLSYIPKYVHHIVQFQDLTDLYEGKLGCVASFGRNGYRSRGDIVFRKYHGKTTNHLVQEIRRTHQIYRKCAYHDEFLQESDVSPA
jgi:hypothetical protein